MSLVLEMRVFHPESFNKSIKKSLNMKMKKKTPGNNPLCIKLKIHESNGNVFSSPYFESCIGDSTKEKTCPRRPQIQFKQNK